MAEAPTPRAGWRLSTLPECAPCVTVFADEAQQWRDEGHDVRELLEPVGTADAALSVPAVPLTPRDVARQVFALCEQFEDLQDSPADSFGLQRHIAGQRFAAKRIRNAIGDWLTEQERAHNITGAPDHG